MSRTALPTAGEMIKARVAGKFVLLLVHKVEEIKGHTYIEGPELKKVSTAQGEKMRQIGARLHHSGSELYVKGNTRTVRPEQVI